MDSEHLDKMGHPPLQPSFLQPSEGQRGNVGDAQAPVRQQGLEEGRGDGLSNSAKGKDIPQVRGHWQMRWSQQGSGEAQYCPR